MLKTGEEDKMNSSSEFQDSLDVVFILNWSPDFHLQITEMLNEIYCVSVSNFQKVSTSCLFLFFFPKSATWECEAVKAQIWNLSAVHQNAHEKKMQQKGSFWGGGDEAAGKAHICYQQAMRSHRSWVEVLLHWGASTWEAGKHTGAK